MTLKTINVKLTPRDLTLIKGIATYKFLSVSQLHPRFFPTSQNYRTATNRLTLLTHNNIVSRIFTYPKAVPDPKGRPGAVYYFAPQNLRTLDNYFHSQHQADRFHDFQHLPTTDNHEDGFSPQYLRHELGISDFFLSLEAAAHHQTITIPFWERTSPFSKELTDTRVIQAEVTKKISGRTTTTTERLPFNPDGFFCLKDSTDTHTFYFVEYDNNSSPPDRFRKKLMGYLAVASQHRFPPIRDYYAKKYALALPSPDTNQDKAPFRVLTVTPTERRRDTLFLDALVLRSFKRFLFASMTDIIPDKPLTPVWLRGKEYTQIAEAQKTLSPDLTKTLQSQWLTNQLAAMPRVSLMD